MTKFLNQRGKGRSMVETIIWTPGVTLDEIEKQVIKKALIHFRGNKTATSIALGISVSTIGNKLEQYAIEEKRLEQEYEERKQRDRDFLARSRGITPELPRNPSQSAPVISEGGDVSVSEQSGISDVLPSQVTTFRPKRSR